MAIETDENGYLIPGTLPDPILEGHGVGNHLPRVNIRMTARQLGALLNATAQLRSIADTEAEADELGGILAALATVQERISGAPPFVLADISIAPEVTFDD